MHFFIDTDTFGYKLRLWFKQQTKVNPFQTTDLGRDRGKTTRCTWEGLGTERSLAWKMTQVPGGFCKFFDFQMAELHFIKHIQDHKSIPTYIYIYTYSQLYIYAYVCVCPNLFIPIYMLIIYHDLWSYFIGPKIFLETSASLTSPRTILPASGAVAATLALKVLWPPWCRGQRCTLVQRPQRLRHEDKHHFGFTIGIISFLGIWSLPAQKNRNVLFFLRVFFSLFGSSLDEFQRVCQERELALLTGRKRPTPGRPGEKAEPKILTLRLSPYKSSFATTQPPKTGIFDMVVSQSDIACRANVLKWMWYGLDSGNLAWLSGQRRFDEFHWFFLKELPTWDWQGQITFVWSKDRFWFEHNPTRILPFFHIFQKGAQL